MSENRRRGDDTARTYFRSGRLIHQMGAWYIATREGELGPFTDRAKAQDALQRYVTRREHQEHVLAEAVESDPATHQRLREEWQRLLDERALQNEFKTL
jgi:hypothetical protein